MSYTEPYLISSTTKYADKIILWRLYNTLKIKSFEMFPTLCRISRKATLKGFKGFFLYNLTNIKRLNALIYNSTRIGR